MSTYIYTSQHALSLDESMLGGKAANLAWLSREEFPVPEWWVVTSDALQHLLDQNHLTVQFSQQLTEITANLPFNQLEQKAESLKQAIRTAQLPTQLQQQLAEIISQYPSTYFAVRSSVIGEDAENASFAGQMDSFLFQQGLKAITDSLLAVMASAFNARALQYRLHKQLPLNDIRCAVIIQEMVEGEVSGVIFTANPVSGNRQQALISANWGTGEGVVSGECDTDEFSINLFDDQTEAKIAVKKTAIIFDHQSARGTILADIPEAKQHETTLTTQQILTLRTIGKQIASLRHTPQDIEWTLRDNQFYILQTRPITQLPAPNPPVDRQVVFDNSNIQESYCGVTTPLTFSFASRCYASVYEQTLRAWGMTHSQVQKNRNVFDNMLGLINGRIYYNINNWYKAILVLPFFKTNKSDMERMMGLNDPVDLIEDRQPTLTEQLVRIPQTLWSLAYLLNGFRKMDKLVPKFQAYFANVYQSVPRDQLHTFTTGQLIEKIRWLDDNLLACWSTPIMNDFYVMMMNGKTHRLLEAAGFEQPDTIKNNLLSGEEGIESTEPTKMLLSMCEIVRSRPALRQLIEQGDNALLLYQIRKLDLDFYQHCLNYIELYGDRTMGEQKLESITLRQDPSFLFAILKNYLTRDDLTRETLAANEAKLRSDAEALAFRTIEKKLGPRKLKRFKKVLIHLRNAIRNRENMRFARTRAFGLYRSLFLQIGQQFAMAGLIAQPRDIFYVTINELFELYDGRAVQTDLKPIVTARKQEYATYEDQELPHHFWCWGVICQNEYVYPHTAVQVTSGDLCGTGCYPGIVEQNVRLINNPQDELSLSGQILCTTRTDPGWAPLFPTAGGLLIERGSTLSHSAVVARELGIPAIVGIPDITRILQDGERVRMDGGTGLISRLSTLSQDDMDEKEVVNG